MPRCAMNAAIDHHDQREQPVQAVHPAAAPGRRRAAQEDLHRAEDEEAEA